MSALMTELVWGLLALPFVLVQWIVRMIHDTAFWKTAYAVEIRCRNCGGSISLVGIWRCGCRFTYRGHLLRQCPICGAMPRMVRCFNCGVTERLPELCD